MTSNPAPPCIDPSPRLPSPGRTAILPACLTLLAALSACQENPRATAEAVPAQAQGSPGPRVVSEAALQAAPIWILDSVPVLTIGLEDGPQEYLLGSIAGAVFLPDGRIAVADAQSWNVRVFSGEGVFSHSFGREGDGPGEFRRLSRLGVLDNGSLAVFDRGRFSVGVFDPSGSIEREWRADACLQATGGPDGVPAQGGMMGMAGPTPSPICRDLNPLFIAGDALLFPVGGHPATQDRPGVGEVRIHDTLTVDLAVVTPDAAVRVASMRSSDRIDLGVPQEDYSRLQAVPLFGGEPWFAVRAPWLVYGNSRDAEIRAVRYDTGEERVLTLDLQPAPITPTAMDSVRTRLRLREAMMPEDRWNRYTGRFLSLSEELPPHQPFFTDLMLDGDHRVWVGDYLSSWTGDVILPTAGTWWSVVTLDGEVVARAHFPASAYRERLDPVLDIRGDRVLLRLIDPGTGVHRVGVFRLRPG